MMTDALGSDRLCRAISDVFARSLRQGFDPAHILIRHFRSFSHIVLTPNANVTVNQKKCPRYESAGWGSLSWGQHDGRDCRLACERCHPVARGILLPSRLS